MTVVATGEIDLKLSPGSLSKLENDISGATNKAGQKASGQMSSSFKNVGAAVSAGFAAAGAVKVFGSFIEEAREAEKVTRLTEAVLKSTHRAAGLTAEGFENLANKLSMVTAVDDDLIQSQLNVLATFTNVRNQVGKGNDIFTQAAQAALDMSAALGTDLQGATIQLGKALNDPIKGITALSRAGVSFTQQQKDQIKAMVESGNTLGAQKVILKELSKEFSGAAAAAADPAQRMSVAFNNVKESLDQALLPIITKVADAFTGLSPGMQQIIVAGGLLVGLLVALAPALAVIIPLLGGITAAGVAAALPFVALGVAAGVLAVLIVQHWTTIKETTLTIWNGIKDFFAQWWPFILGIFTGGIGTVIALVIQNWSAIKEATVAAWNAVLGAITGAWSAIVGAVSSGVSTAVGFVRGLPGQFVGALSGLATSLYNLGRDALDAMWRGIKSIIPKLMSLAGGLVKDLISKLNPANWHFSPEGPEAQYSKVFGAAFAAISEEARKALPSIDKMIGDVVRTANPEFAITAGAGGLRVAAGGVDVAVQNGGATPTASVAGLGPITVVFQLDKDVLIRQTIDPFAEALRQRDKALS